MHRTMCETMTKKPRVLDTQVVARSRFFAIEQVRIGFDSGEERVYERLKEWDARSVIIVAIRPPDIILLVREYACGIDGYSLTLPKGMVEADETDPQAANRELMEETGVGAQRIRKLGVLTLAPGHLCHKITVLLAENLYEQRLSGDEPEPLEVIPLRLREVNRLVRSGAINDARTIAAISMWSYLEKETTAEHAPHLRIERRSQATRVGWG